MLKFFLTVCILVIAVQPCVAQSSMGPGGFCIEKEVAAVTAIINSGTRLVCITYGSNGRLGDTSNLGASITGPMPLAAATVTTQFLGLTGCTALGGATTRNDLMATGIGQSTLQPITITDTTCSGQVRWQVTITATAVFDVQLPFSFTVRDDFTQVDNLNRLCNASAFQGTCITPTVSICPESSPCFIESNSTLSINGNVSVNQTNLPPEERPGFDGSLYVLVCIMIAVLMHLGQKSRGNYAFSGFLSLAAGFILFWEMERIGFDNIGQGLLLAGIFTFLHLALAGYLFYLFTGNDENQEETENR